jgi:uncharacterized protein (TIGR02284 family)
MDTNDKTTIAVLNDLIATCKDGIDGFTAAANAVKDPSITRQFLRRITWIEQGKADLEATVRRLGGDPTDSGHAAASLHRGWLNIKAAVGGNNNDREVVEETIRGEEAAVKQYRDAIQKPLPEEIRVLVERQLRGAEENLAAVRTLMPLATSGAAGAAASTSASRPTSGPDARL